MKKLIIKIAPKHAAKAGPYTDIFRCLLGTAIQDQLGLKPGEYSVGGHFVRIKLESYRMSKRGNKNLHRAYSLKDKDAASSLRRPRVTKPFSVTLTSQ